MHFYLGFLTGSVVKNLPATHKTQIWSLGQEDSLEEEMATLLQYSCLENPMDRGVSWASIYGVAKSQIRLSSLMGTILINLFGCPGS